MAAEDVIVVTSLADAPLDDDPPPDEGDQGGEGG